MSHFSSKTTGIVTFVSALSLGLAACSNDSDSQPAEISTVTSIMEEQTTTTTTEVEPTSTAAATSGSTTTVTVKPSSPANNADTPVPAPATAPETTNSPQDPPPANNAAPINWTAIIGTPRQPGDPVDINGATYETCVYGDGYALNIVLANPNTSCGFATSVFRSVTEGLNPTGDNVRTNLPATASATSPVTGQTYQVSCSENNDRSIRCTGGDNAEVLMM